jgi:glycosyltransferase involved in cell wall biosynthesis
MISPVLKIPLKEYIKIFYDNCSAVIALNTYAEEDVRKFGFKGYVQKIPNGRDLSLYNKLKINYSSDKVVLIYVGNINERKNQKFLVESMRFLPKNFELRLIGPVLSNGYYDEILEFIKKYNLENVKYLGKIPYNEIAGQLEESQIFVSAATMEVQSLVIIEAMASGPCCWSFE